VPAAGGHVGSQRGHTPRHGRKCAICHHPDREAIDDDFLCWRSPTEIIEEYQLAHHSTLYRHAHATGLMARRKASVLNVLEHILERAQSAKVTGSSIVNAACLYAQMTGQWKEPEKKYIVERRSTEGAGPENEGSEDLSSAPASDGRRESSLQHQAPSLQNLIANPESEHDATH
jgi:hypothetical protein